MGHSVEKGAEVRGFFLGEKPRTRVTDRTRARGKKVESSVYLKEGLLGEGESYMLSKGSL